MACRHHQVQSVVRQSRHRERPGRDLPGPTLTPGEDLPADHGRREGRHHQHHVSGHQGPVGGPRRRRLQGADRSVGDTVVQEWHAPHGRRWVFTQCWSWCTPYTGDRTSLFNLPNHCERLFYPYSLGTMSNRCSYSLSIYILVYSMMNHISCSALERIHLKRRTL